MIYAPEVFHFHESLHRIEGCLPWMGKDPSRFMLVNPARRNRGGGLTIAPRCVLFSLS
jgi:hypothetical protein